MGGCLFWPWNWFPFKIRLDLYFYNEWWKMFECDLIFCKYRCICVDIGNILVGLLHSSLSHLNQRKTNFVSKSSWIYFSINKFTSVLTFPTVLLIIIYLVCRTLIRCFETFKDTDATPPQIDHTWLAMTSRCQFR